MGVLLFAPVLLTWSTRGLGGWSHRRRLEFIVLLFALALTLEVAFRWQRLPPSLQHPATYAPLPFIIWAALRFEARGASMALLTLAAVAVPNTLGGIGPFALHLAEEPANATSSLLFLQFFLAAMSVSSLLLAAAHTENRVARETAARLNLELHHSLEELAIAQAELVRRERMAALGEMSASVAHEVRNPLGVIANAVAALHRLLAPEPGSTPRVLLGVMGEEVSRLDHLVDGLLEYARPTTPRLLLQPLGTVVDGALEASLRAGVSTGPIQVTRAFDASLPEALLDAPMMHLALSNLIINALQAMPQGGSLRLELHQDLSQGRPEARLVIADTGSGISPEVRARLFEPFFTTKASGTGLGLAIVRRIVEAHQGHVYVESTPGQGTCFTLHLPLSPRAPPA